MARILVVEDEPDILELVRLHLDQAGYSVETAESGEDALQVLSRGSFDLVVLDLMLPGRSGSDICRELRRKPDTADLPVIMLTAKGEEVDRIVGFEIGADDYVTKPFSPRELVLRAKRRAAAQRARARRSRRAAPASSKPSPEASTSSGTAARSPAARSI